MRDPRLEKLADVLVNYSVGVKKDQVVRISGPPVAEPLIVELYRKIVAAGGHPFARMAPAELTEIFLKTGSDAQLQYVSPIALFEYEQIDASIGIWGEENTKALTNVDPKRIGLQQAARKPLLETFMKRAAEGKLHWCGTQFPCNAAAQDAEMSLSEYEDFVFSAGLLNHPDPVAAWKKVSERQQRLADLLKASKGDYRVVAANGTDLRMSVAGRKWINCDGHENFPGREVEGVRLTFREGKVVDASASKGEEFLIGMLDTDEGSRFLGECAIGTNY